MPHGQEPDVVSIDRMSVSSVAPAVEPRAGDNGPQEYVIGKQSPLLVVRNSPRKRLFDIIRTEPDHFDHQNVLRVTVDQPDAACVGRDKH